MLSIRSADEMPKFKSENHERLFSFYPWSIVHKKSVSNDKDITR